MLKNLIFFLKHTTKFKVSIYIILSHIVWNGVFIKMSKQYPLCVFFKYTLETDEDNIVTHRRFLFFSQHLLICSNASFWDLYSG